MSETTKRLVYFGDSVTDIGTIRSLTEQLFFVPFPLESAGYTDAFSNGPLYSDIVPGLLGIETVENFAAGGGGAIGERRLGELIPVGEGNPILRPDANLDLLAFDLNFQAQIGRFVDSERDQAFEGGTTASIFTGLIDLSSFAEDAGNDPAAAATQLLAGIVASTLEGATRLVEEGGVDRLILYREFVHDGAFGFVSEHLSYYIDYDAIARDLSFDYHETRSPERASSMHAADAAGLPFPGSGALRGSRAAKRSG